MVRHFNRRPYSSESLTKSIDQTSSQAPRLRLTDQYETFELDYLPWFNVRFILQYNVYQIVNNNQNPLLSQ